MKLLALLSHASLVVGAALKHKSHATFHSSGHHKRTGTLPVQTYYIEFLGNVTDVEGRDIRRDQGWVSSLGDSVYLTYGDTLWFDPSGNWRGIVSDTIARWTDNPLKVDFLHRNIDGFPQQFCPLFVNDPSNYAMTISQIIEPVAGSGNGKSSRYTTAAGGGCGSSN